MTVHTHTKNKRTKLSEQQHYILIELSQHIDCLQQR